MSEDKRRCGEDSYDNASPKNMKKILSVLCIMGMLISAVAGTVTVFAEEGEESAMEEESILALPDVKWGEDYKYGLAANKKTPSLVVALEGDLPEGIAYDEEEECLAGKAGPESAGKTYIFHLQTKDEEGRLVTDDVYSLAVPYREITTVIITGGKATANARRETAESVRVRAVSDLGLIEIEDDQAKASWRQDDGKSGLAAFDVFKKGESYMQDISVNIPEGYVLRHDVTVTLNNVSLRPFLSKNDTAVTVHYYCYKLGSKAVEHTVSFSLNPPKLNTIDDKVKITATVPKQTVLHGNYAVTPIEPASTSYKFSGWFLDKEGEELFDFDETQIVDDVKLYAAWIEAISSVDISMDEVYAADTAALPAMECDEIAVVEALSWHETEEAETPYTGKLELGRTYYLKGNVKPAEGKAVFVDEDFSVKVNGTDAAVSVNEKGGYDFLVPIVVIEAPHQHTMEKVDATPATCEKSGYVAHYHCTSCGGRFLDEEGNEPIEEGKGETPALGHNWGEWGMSRTPTCDAEGAETRYCRNDPSHSETRPVDPVGHEFGEWITSKQATCETAGEEIRLCVHDSSHRETRTVPATGHNYGEWTVTKAAACTEEGIETRTCANNASHQETRSVAKSDHKWGEWETVQNPTEKQEGSMKRKCSVCGTEESQVIPALKHTHALEKKAAVAATCEKAGNIEYYYCSGCNKNFSDEKAEKEITSVYLPALGHSWQDWRIVQSSTAESEGLRERTCLRCGQKQSEKIAKIDTPVLKTYEIDQGKDLAWTKDSKDALHLTSSAPGGRFVGIYVDGKVVNVLDYKNNRPTNVDGPTDIEIKTEYLEKLDPGAHSMELRYITGSATATLTIKAAPVKETPAPTPAPSSEPTQTPTPTSTPTPVTHEKEKRSVSGLILPILLLLLILGGAVAVIADKNGLIDLPIPFPWKKPAEGKHSEKERDYPDNNDYDE